ncbi:MAG TPA: dihydrolipoyllysine-residue succinyltransferase [Candidatus Acidoferrales bacterium]|jgi:2-oxoglutarate dehydrogenase E2 component (dihydrolipoamide succinyltransferase)|nr:dihydrolipoyllysine-residue succinyltransferase [Candidatus Acidoferrales bacterium]
MSIELTIPSVGESITEVQIAEWLKADGDAVKKDENVAVIDSEKTTFELPAPEDGKLKILRQAGETIQVGGVVGRIESNGESAKAEPAAKKAKEPEKAPAPKKEAPRAAEEKPKAEVKVEKPAPAPAPRPSTEPRASASGPGTKQSSVPGRELEVVPMTMLRKTAARRLAEAKQQMAMLTTFNEADVSAVQALRAAHQENFEKRYQVKLGFMPFFVKAVIDGLKQYPQLNAEIRDTDIVYHDYFDIGVAIAGERGLVVPVLRNAERLSFADIEKAIADFAKRSREGKLKPDELEGGTFTITNGGVFGSLLSTPIINPPQTGILGMHSIQERPIALNGQVVIRPMMYIALTYDHRLVDGREAVLFLRRIKEAIENPARMLIEV